MKNVHMACQMLPAEQFRQLSGNITEAEGDSLPTLNLYRRLVRSGVCRRLDDYVSSGDGDVERRVAGYFRKMFEYENATYVRFAGIGTSRIVFAGDDGVAVKFQYRPDSMQMEREINASLQFGDLCCFPRLFDYDESKRSAAVECCRQAKKADFVRIYGFEFAEMTRAVKGSAYADSELVDMMDSSELPEWESMYTLKQFVKLRGLRDIEQVANWGLAMREGRETPVLIDFAV